MNEAPGAGERGLTITPLDGPLAEAHARFAARMWPTKQRRRAERFNRWKFRGPEQGPVPGLLLAVAHGEVVGQLGLIPAVLSLGGDRIACQWACDLMVDSALRRQGVGSALFRSALSRGVVTLGSNPSSAANVTMQRVGFQVLVGPRIAVLPLDATHLLSWKAPAVARPLIPLASAAARPFLRWRAERLVAKGERTCRTAIVAWGEVVPLVAERQKDQAEACILHDADFLAWRCSGLTGFVEPLRALKTEDGSYAIVGPGTPYFYVYDWHAESERGLVSIFGAAVRMALEAGALTVETLAGQSQKLHQLRGLGFLRLRSPVSILWHSSHHAPPPNSRMAYSLFDSDGNL